MFHNKFEFLILAKKTLTGFALFMKKNRSLLKTFKIC